MRCTIAGTLLVDILTNNDVLFLRSDISIFNTATRHQKLFHGFGFASVLGDIGLTDEFLVYSLLGFNIGVELGQFVIIALIFPVLYLIRKNKLYPKILVGGSIFLILASIYWIIERVFDVNLGIEDAVTYVFRGVRARLFR